MRFCERYEDISFKGDDHDGEEKTEAQAQTGTGEAGQDTEKEEVKAARIMERINSLADPYFLDGENRR